MSTNALVASTMFGALTYAGCTVGAKLDQNVSIAAAIGVAAVVGGIVHNNTPKEKVVTAEEEAWEKELQEGGKTELTEDETKENEEKKKG